MLSKEDFIKYIVHGPQAEIKSETMQEESDSALPEGFDSFGFDSEDEVVSANTGDSSFAHNLLIASGFGNPEHIERSEVILSTDTAAKHLPNLVYYWPKNDDRPYQTLLFELEQSGLEVLKPQLFNPLGGQQLLEDALSRFVQYTLKGFEKGGEKRTASVRQGRQAETLCIISVVDDRDKENDKTHLVCFGTKNKANDSLETFHIREEAKLWEPQIREDHLGKLYDRHFKKITSEKWQNAFISKEERKLARKLLDTCIDHKATEHDIEKGVVNLLEEIAGSYGLRRSGGKRLKPFQLPKDHDIGSDPESRKDKNNPFKGMTLRDEKNRLLGYIIYCLDEKQDAEQLRNYLQVNNRFHNVLVIYPNGDQANLELWQGKTALPGKLLKDGANYSGEGEVVNLLSRFFVVSKAKVKNPVELAQELAYRARYLRRLAIKELTGANEDGPLHDLYTAFKDTLIHDQTEDEFADAFAQTLTYGLLTSRWMGSDRLAQSGDRFTRQTALKYLPSTSNFLGDLFRTALSVKLDEQRGRLFWLVDDIANLLDRIDVSYVFGIGDVESDQVTDPVIHFYEPFLAAYDNDLRNKRGVYFTPRPVVSFIVRGVHQLLQEKYGLEDGLGSTETWLDVQNRFPELELPEGVNGNDCFVSILDPATGTGTFLYECVDLIEKIMKDKWCLELQLGWTDSLILSRWSEYVAQYLIPRLYGYELMMASYSIAHLKLAFKLRETGCKLASDLKLHIYTTNTLEPPTDIQKDLVGMMPALALEAKEVNNIKRNKRFTVIIGNPPYAVTSSNKNRFIGGLMEDYKKLVKGEHGLVALSDDYLKFIRISQYFLKKSGVGIWGMVTNHSYLKGIIHRGVRNEVIKQFSLLHVLDLHGDSNIGENPPSGLDNENVFDIQQGVAVSIGVSTPGEIKGVFKYKHSWGDREQKFTNLNGNSLGSCEWVLLTPSAQNYFLIPFDSTYLDEYESFFALNEMMPVNSCGVKTHRDNVIIDFEKQSLADRMFDIANDSDLESLKLRYGIHDTKNWSLQDAKNKIKASEVNKFIHPITYRPFDSRWIYYNPKIIEKGDSKFPTLKHMFSSNLAILASRIQASGDFNAAFVSTDLVEMKTAESSRSSTVFPLFLDNEQDSVPRKMFEVSKSVNFSNKFIKLFSQYLGNGAEGLYQLPKGITPENVLAYIYSVLYSPKYREKYNTFLKVGFPRIPLISNYELFSSLELLGSKLINLHLMKSSKLENFLTTIEGDMHVEIKNISYKDQKVFVDKERNNYFKGVPEGVWEFRIGGYQVCHKWLKDRKAKGGKKPVPGRVLTSDDIVKYQKIIVSISETIRLQGEIDKAIDKHGGWPNAFVTSDQGDDS